MADRPSFIHVGTISGPHGVRGEVKIRSLLDNPEDLLTLGALTDADGGRVFHLTRKGHQQNVLIVSLEGINDRNAAEAMKGTKLYVLADRLPALSEREWYHADLVGLAAQLENGERYGKIIALHNFGAGDIVEIETTAKKIEMLPFKEPYVGKVSTEDGFLIVRPPDYIEPEAKK